MQVSCAILAVGAELLQGQISNSNAATMSRALFSYGIVPTHHLTVDDKVEEIVAALSYLSGLTSLIFITGGLGPTSDDLTRNGVSAWSQAELKYDEASWVHIEEKFGLLGRQPTENNRQQCFFPRGAKILKNREGTANGFYLKANAGTEVWVLPGPPRELDAIWHDHIEADLMDRVPLTERRIMRKWRVVGRGESALAEKLEPIIDRANVAGLNVDIAYRAQVPVVEIKVRFPSGNEKRMEEYVSEIEAELRPHLYEIGDESLPEKIISKVGELSENAVIVDQATNGYLGELLLSGVRKATSSFTMVSGSADLELKGLKLGVKKMGEEYLVYIADKEVKLRSPYKNHPHLKDREYKTVAVLTLKIWREILFP